MKRRMSTSLVALGLLLAAPRSASALDQIPDKSGFGGYLEFGGGPFLLKSNLIAGTRLRDAGPESIASISDRSEAARYGGFVGGGRLAYTFASSRTQLYYGPTYGEYLRYDSRTHVGVSHKLEDKTIIAASYVFSSVPADYWKDPYVVNRDRSTTARTVSGFELAADRILGSGLEITYTLVNVRIDDDLSGLTPVGQGGLGLNAAQAAELRGSGKQHDLQATYRFRIGRHNILAPGVLYTLRDYEGGAMSTRNNYTTQLTYGYDGGRIGAGVNVLYGYNRHDDVNPIYGERERVDGLGLELSAVYKNPFNLEHVGLKAGVAMYRGNSNIDFYDQTTRVGMLTVVFQF